MLVYWVNNVLATFILNTLPVLAVIPLLVVLFLRSFPDIGVRRSYHYNLWPPVLFFMWQVVLSAWVFKHPHWNFWIRLIDPIIFGGLVWAVLEAEITEKGKYKQHSIAFLKSIAICVVINFVVQLLYIKNFPPTFNRFPSQVLVLILWWRFQTSYGRWAIRPRGRDRLSILLVFLAAVFPLPFFRVLPLTVIAWSWMRTFFDAMGAIKADRQQNMDEKELASTMSENLTEVMQAVTNFQETAQKFLQNMCQVLEIKSSAIYIWHEDQNHFRATALYGPFQPMVVGTQAPFLRIEQLHKMIKTQVITEENNLIWQCGHGKKPIYIPYASLDERIITLGDRQHNIQSLVLSPLVLENDLLGVLVLQNKLYERYISESDFYLSHTFAHYATMMINSSRMLSQRIEQERVTSELNLGQKIQADLLPHKIPEVEGIELAGSMTPAKEIGGDYFDFFQRDDGRLGIAIGDVSGKGVPAGMLMTILQTILESKYPFYPNTYELLVDTNKEISRKIKSSMFITMLLFEWDYQHKKLRYTACGHEHILHYSKSQQKLFTLRSGGIALGMTDDVSEILRERELPVQEGDVVLLYTDGVIEERNAAGEMYDLEKLQIFVENHASMGADELRLHLL